MKSLFTNYNTNKSENKLHKLSSVNQEKKSGSIIAGVWVIKEKLGQGSFGEVRLASNIITKKESDVAIKFEHKSDIKKHLETEKKVYLALGTYLQKDNTKNIETLTTKSRIKGFPNIYWFGKHGDYTALVMDRLGASLKTLYSRCNRIFPTTTVCMITIQLLDRLETLHDCGWLHQDIKPENICVGVDTKKSILHLIDYGTSATYIDSLTKQHQIRQPSTKIVGTARYSSLNNHYGYKQSRRDDLESLGYTIIYWLLGRLPWQGIDEKDFRVKWKKVRRVKRNITPDELCKGLPIQFKMYMNYVFKLSYQQRPNYSFLRSLFRQLIPENKKLKFSWENFKVSTV